MGFIRRLADRLDPLPAARIAPPVETRSADLSWQALAGAYSDAGAVLDGRAFLTPRIAENLAAYAACISAISGALASFPVYVFRKDAKGRAADDRHALARLIANGPNANQSFADFIEMLSAEALAHGNGLAEIKSTRGGEITGMDIIPWRQVTPVLLNSGRLAFDVTAVSALYGGAGRTRRLLDTEVLHLKDRSDDGLIGRSRLARSASAVRAGLAQEEFGAFLYQNKAAPGGLLSLKGTLTQEELSVLQAHMEEHLEGARNAGQVMVSSGEAKYTPLNVTPENLEMLAARRFTVEEIARLFQVPPPIIGDYTHNTFTNSETAGRWFGQFTLMPWVRKLEETFRRAFFSESERAGYEIEFDMTALLRSDPEARWKAHEIAVKNRILTQNEVRELEGWNSRPELDAAPAQGAGTS